MKEDIEFTEKDKKVSKKMIALEMPSTLYNQLQEECKKTCLGTSALVRLIIVRYFENQKTC